MEIEESLNVTFDETHPPSKTSPLVDDDLVKEKAIKATEKKNLENDIEDETLEIDEIVTPKIVKPTSSLINTRKIKESLNVTFDETPLPYKTSPLVDDDLDKEEEIKATKKKKLENVVEDETLEIDEIVDIKESWNHPFENVMGNLN
nr:hypothetical protein CTI12_AA182560 [Tanacetum cinerariifolium]